MAAGSSAIRPALKERFAGKMDFGKASGMVKAALSGMLAPERKEQVIVGIKPDQLGQISCRIGEERVEKLARTVSGEEIKPGQLVRIDSIGSDSVIVSVDTGERLSLFSGEA